MTTPIARLKACVALGGKATGEPWAINPLNAQIDAFVTGEPLAVCQMLWPTEKRTEAETEANAALIVALRNSIPDLEFALSRLEACERALEECVMVMGDTSPVDWENDFSKVFASVLEAARAALGSKP